MNERMDPLIRQSCPMQQPFSVAHSWRNFGGKNKQPPMYCPYQRGWGSEREREVTTQYQRQQLPVVPVPEGSMWGRRRGPPASGVGRGRPATATGERECTEGGSEVVATTAALSPSSLSSIPLYFSLQFLLVVGVRKGGAAAAAAWMGVEACGKRR